MPPSEVEKLFRAFAEERKRELPQFTPDGIPITMENKFDDAIYNYLYEYWKTNSGEYDPKDDEIIMTKESSFTKNEKKFEQWLFAQYGMTNKEQREYTFKGNLLSLGEIALSAWGIEGTGATKLVVPGKFLASNADDSAKKALQQDTIEDAMEGTLKKEVENLFDCMNVEDKVRYLAWERAHANGIIPENPDIYVRFGYLLDKGVGYDNAYFLATLDRNIYEAFDEDEIIKLITNVENYASTLSKSKRNPAAVGVYNKLTGEYFYGVNSKDGSVLVFATQLKEYFDNMPEDVLQSYINSTKNAGSHAELWALNEALLSNPSSSVDDFLLYVMHGNNKDYGMPFIRCPHCQWISQQFYSIYK